MLFSITYPRLRTFCALLTGSLSLTTYGMAEQTATSPGTYKLDGDSFTNSLGMKFVKIPAGEFTMGSPESEKYRAEDEKQKTVKISSAFWMLSTEITQGHWHKVTDISLQTLVNTKVGALGRGAKLKNTPSAVDNSHPMCFVSYSDVMEFCKKLTEKEKGKIPPGYKFTLPTEAQWEYTARAGSSTVFSYGDVLTSDKANFLGKFPYGTKEEGKTLKKTTPVASYEPNQWGLYDMHGNVYEWCLDWFVDELPGGTDPVSLAKGDSRCIRGGAWNRRGESCRSAYRYSYDPTQRTNNIGFRVVLVPEK